LLEVNLLSLSNDGVFNIEGGCYAKCAGLDPLKEPDIYNAIRFGSVLENVKFYDQIHREVDYNDTSITANTRCSYPLEYISGAKLPAVGGHPKNIIFLTCDAHGVLPPVAKLNHTQSMYHFISGYTANMAGVVAGENSTSATFSACFGEAFLPRHPVLYAEMLEQKLKQHGTNVWLLNTGWINGKYGVGTVDLYFTLENLAQAYPSDH
jgi:phosphoenolpyruvate carboxykinase (ATP)